MKQALLHKGKITVENLPTPTIKDNEILVQTAFSLISAGTELSGKSNSATPFIKKILSNPKNIQKGLSLFKQSGLKKTLEIANSLEKTRIALGYSLSGIIVDIGSKIKEFQIGDRVACAGSGKANHAEFVSVPQNLVVKIPKNLNFQDASSVTLGSIAMQGLRRADVKLGENIAVIGLGLLGQILIQLLKVNGTRVIGFDIDDKKINLAKKLKTCQAYNSSKIKISEKVFDFTEGKGVDATIITASAHQNNKIIQQAMEITKKKGKVVVVGDIGLGPKRTPFYEKEIDYLMSTSYGPGRYDKNYEEKGIDYPFAYVRWTEKRNMEEYLKLLTDKKIDFQSLISQIFPIEKAADAYKFLEENRLTKPAVLLDYHSEGEKPRKTKIEITSVPFEKDVINLGVIGVGGFAKGMHLPNLKKLPNLYSIYAICDLDGNNAQQTAKKFGARYCTTDYKKNLGDKNIDMVMITLPHNLHAKTAIETARAGKAIFCEKPMALNIKELQEIVDALKKTKMPYLVGFNRRFSPFAKKIKKIIQNRENPMIINYQMNAGYLSKEHWTQTEIGGGRNVGEACHLYDLFTYFTESEIEKISAISINPKIEKYSKNDNFTAVLKFKDGSICNLTYTALGTKNYPKEQMKIYFDGQMIFLNDYKEMKIYGAKEKGLKLKRQDKGHLTEMKEFAQAIKNGTGYPIPLWQLIQATKISFEVEKQINL